MTSSAYWAQIAYDIGLRRQAHGQTMPIALIGTSRTMSLEWGSLAGLPVLNMGFSGITLPEIVPYVAPLLGPSNSLYLRSILIEMGINDVSMATANPTQWANYTANLSGLVALAKQSTPRVGLITTVPFEYPLKADAADWVDEIAVTCGAMWLCGAAHDAPVFDANAMFRKADKTALNGFTIDGTHWSPVGMTALKQVYERAAAYLEYRWPN